MHNIRKTFIRILSVLLILVMVFPQGISVKASSADGQVGTGMYLLAISTGNTACDYVEKILVKYQTSKGVLYTQVIEPTDYKTDFMKIRYEDNNEKIADLNATSLSYDDYKSKWGLANIGNINFFYNAAISNQKAATYSGYDSMYKNIFSNKYYSEYTLEARIKRTNKTAFFRSNSMEYICFRTDEDASKFLSLEFILKDEAKLHSCDWSLNGWKLFDLTASPELWTYSFFSDRVGISYSGILVAQSLKLMDGEYPGFDKTDGISHIIFTDIDDTDIPVFVDTLVGSKAASVHSFDYNSENGFDYTAYDMTSNQGDKFNGYEIGKRYTSSARRFIFKVNIADQGGSGIESFLSPEGSSGIVLRDILNASVNYTNDFGYTENVTVPVISNSIFEYGLLTNANNKSMYDVVLSKNEVYAYAQEGSSLLFCMNFPDIKSLDSIKLILDNQQDPSDEVIIKSIEVYEVVKTLNGSLFENKRDSGVIEMCIKDTWAHKYIYASDPNQRDLIMKKSGESASFNLVDAKNIPEYSDAYEDTYIITLETSNAPEAGTAENVYFRYSYLDKSGKTNTSEEYTLTELCEQFYGYNTGIVEGLEASEENVKKIKTALPWAYPNIRNSIYYSNGKVVSKDVIKVDVNYLTHMKQGSTMNLLVKIDDLERFTDFSFRMENGEDIWQLDTISVSRLISLGERVVEKLNKPVSYQIGTATGGSIKYGFDVKRSFQGETIGLYENVDLLLQNNNDSTFEIDSEEIDTEESGRDYLDYYLDMEYSKAVSGLQFDTAAMHYDVRVSVAGAEDSTADDDAGSGNLFYFQLVFKNGVSAFVLANQQLESDGFRAGKTEAFTISTNENYGDITAIRIIPDEISDEGDKLDKLNIDSIEVVSSGPGQPKKSTKFYNIGWIGSDYFENSGRRGRSGKSLQEAAVTVTPSSQSDITSLEFTIQTGTLSSSSDQFVGTMSADIVYINSRNETAVLRDIDVVSKIYEYMEKDAPSVNAKDKKRTSDSNWMFRQGHEDRFVIDMSDIRELVSIKLYPNPQKEVEWKLKGISVSIIYDDGQLCLNDSGDFQKKLSDEDRMFITDKVSNKNLPFTFTLPAGVSSTHIFSFASGDIPQSESRESGFDSVSRVPESAEDSVNIFMYMAEGAMSPEEGNYDMNLGLYYSSASTGKSYARTIDTKQPSCTYRTYKLNGKTVLCFMGVSANYLSKINYFSAKTQSDTNYAVFEKIIVQHIRNNTIIDSYNMSMFAGDAGSRYGLTAYEGISQSSGNSQILTLHLAEDSSAFSIVAEKRDIAASLVYTSDQDPDRKLIYSSKNVFLSDSKIYSVDGGSMLSFKFNESNIDEIKAVRITALNGASCIIDTGIIECYESDANGEKELKKYVSIDPGIDTEVSGAVEIAPTSVYIPNQNNQPVASKLHRVDLSFKTMTPASDSDSTGSRIDSNGSCPIKLKINYIADLSSSATIMRSVSYDDLRNIAGTDSSFVQGGTANISLFIPGIRRISSVEIEPVSEEGGSASWNLESISFSISDTGYSNTRVLPLNRRITNNSSGVFYLSDMSVNLTVSGSGISNADGASNKVSDSTMKIAGNPGDRLTVYTSVDGSYFTFGYGYRIEKIVKNNAKVLVSEKTSQGNKTSFVYTLPEYDFQHDSNEYLITVYAEENPELCSCLDIVLIEPELPVKEDANAKE